MPGAPKAAHDPYGLQDEPHEEPREERWPTRGDLAFGAVIATVFAALIAAVFLTSGKEIPTYRYVCVECSKAQDAIRRVDDRDDCPACACGAVTERRIVAPMVSVFNSYRAVAADKETGERPVIRNRAEHEAFLRRNGYEEVGNDRSMAPLSPDEWAHRRAEKLNEENEARAEMGYALNEETHEANLEVVP